MTTEDVWFTDLKCQIGFVRQCADLAEALSGSGRDDLEARVLVPFLQASWLRTDGVDKAVRAWREPGPGGFRALCAGLQEAVEPSLREALAAAEQGTPTPAVGGPKGVGPEQLVHCWVGQARLLPVWEQMRERSRKKLSEARVRNGNEELVGRCTDLVRRLEERENAWFGTLSWLRFPHDNHLLAEARAALTYLRDRVGAEPAAALAGEEPQTDWVAWRLRELDLALAPRGGEPGLLEGLGRQLEDKDNLKTLEEEIIGKLQGGSVWRRAVGLLAVLAVKACPPWAGGAEARGPLARFLGAVVGGLDYELLTDAAAAGQVKIEESPAVQAESIKTPGLRLRVPGSQEEYLLHLVVARPPRLGRLEQALRDAHPVLEKVGFKEPFPEELSPLRGCPTVVEAKAEWKKLARRSDAVVAVRWYLQCLALLWDGCPEGRLAAAHLILAFQDLGFQVSAPPIQEGVDDQGLVLTSPTGEKSEITCFLWNGVRNRSQGSKALQCAWQVWRLVRELNLEESESLTRAVEGLFKLEYRETAGATDAVARDRRGAALSRAARELFELANNRIDLGRIDLGGREKYDLLLQSLRSWGSANDLKIEPEEWTFARPLKFDHEAIKRYNPKLKFMDNVPAGQSIVKLPSVFPADAHKAEMLISLGKEPDYWGDLKAAVDSLRDPKSTKALELWWKSLHKRDADKEAKAIEAKAAEFYRELVDGGLPEGSTELRQDYESLIELFFKVSGELHGFNRWEPRSTKERQEKWFDILNSEVSGDRVRTVVVPGVLDRNGEPVSPARVVTE